MKITVIGATGMVGSRVITEAVTRGHDVVAAARTPAPRPSPAVDSRRVDATDPRQVDEALTGADALVLAVRAAPGDLELVAAATEVVLHSAQRLGARVLVVGGAGPLRSPDRPGTLVVDDPRYVPPAWRQVAGVSVRQLEVCQAHPDAAWAYLSPPALLEPGTRTGRYLRGTTTVLTAQDGKSWISAEDLAVAVVDELEQAGADRLITVAAAED